MTQQHAGVGKSKITDELEPIMGGAFFHVLTRRERFWRWMGFTYHLGEFPPEADVMPGWMRTDSTLNFGLADRLRLLLTGKLYTSTQLHFDTPSPALVHTRFDWRIFAPGEKQ